MIVKSLKDVIPGDVLKEDIIHNNIFLIRKGTELSRKLIRLLRKRDIKDIKILTSPPHSKQLPLTGFDFKNANSEINKDKAYDYFFELLAAVGFEHRYGILLNKEIDVKQLMQLFYHIYSEQKLMIQLDELRKWDYYTFIHSFDVFILGTILAQRMGIHQLASVALGYLFHDIGKTKIPQDLLGKKSSLTTKEFAFVQNHAIEGETILNSLGQDHASYLARSHHERLDGTGYPDQLSNMQLSTALRILHIVDVYSALTLKRSYKDAIPSQIALQMLIQDEGTYDTNILHHFIEALGIYPVYATVLLSDQTIATINRVNKHTPTLPIVKRLHDNVSMVLPIDFSITISKMLDFRDPKMT